ncbi:hypothetical protein ACAW74_22805 [Fibrella sp. WM1]|uniref:5'-methylthioadenosine/S-adenosylhomocysteine nucleosidase family protein n=1 Tax=Fibrella musci TaxID=3242485 RepID=UPI00352237D1
MNFEKNSKNNIFLDFLNPDLRRGWGIYDNPVFSSKFLKELINFSVFLTEKTCYLPLAFILEDPITFKTVKEAKLFFEEGYITIPMKLTDNLEETLSKLFKSYRLVKGNYSLFNDKENFDKAIEFIQEIYTARVEKKYNTGKHISLGFLSQLENGDKYWQSVLNEYSVSSIKQFQQIPGKLIEKGLSITHGDIINELGGNKFNIFDIHKLLNYEYGLVYMEEFNAVALYNIFQEYTFSPTNRRDNKGYDYQITKKLFSTLGIKQFISEANAYEIINIRRNYVEYHEFINNYYLIANSQNQYIESFLAELISSSNQLKNHLEKKKTEFISFSFLIDTLGFVNEALKKMYRQKESTDVDYAVKHSGKPMEQQIRISIFVALKEEEDVLKEVLKLKHDRKTNTYTKVSKNIHYEVFSPRQIGRVSAALKTYQHLVDRKNALPDLLIVAGIAGGFEIKGVNRGDIIIPTFILDVSNTKKEGRSSDRDKNEIFRSHPFKVFRQLEYYLNSPNFSKDKWALKILSSSAGKPYNNRIPNIFYKPISCCDSVIKDEEWINDILKIDPELVGVEMESGGVCFATEEFKGIPVAVIRGVSDLANPYKADDVWRNISMQAVANLIKEINFSDVLGNFKN